MQLAEVVIKEVDILKKVQKAEAKDDEIVKVVKEMKKAGVKMVRDKE